MIAVTGFGQQQSYTIAEDGVASYTAQFDLYNQEHLRRRVTVAVAKAAQDVAAEPAATAHHLKRFAWAIDASRQPYRQADYLMPLMLHNATIADGYVANPDGSTVTDGDIQFVVNSMVNLLAGADTSA